MPSSSRGRFAPSPTGALHLGNVWTALLTWLQQRQRGGTVVLRIEDLDPERSRPAWTAQLMDDLRWLGLDWDEGPDVGGLHAPYIQDERRASYTAALDALLARGLVYRCFCSRAELRAAAAPHGAELRGVCVGQCWALPAAAVAQRLHVRPAALRVRVPATTAPISFDDQCVGPVTEDVAATAGDFVVCRADGVHAYQLAVVVDDGAMAITDVVRGADLLTSTARQIWLHRELGYHPPRFAHVPLLVDSAGHRLSKRQAALAVAALRAAGHDSAAIIGQLAAWAGINPGAAPCRPRDLIGALDLAQLPAGPVIVDPAVFAA